MRVEGVHITRGYTHTIMSSMNNRVNIHTKSDHVSERLEGMGKRPTFIKTFDTETSWG